MLIRLSRASLDLPSRTRSSAKSIAEMLIEPRLTPRPDELSLEPRLLINRQNNKGERLQPENDQVSSTV